MSLLGVLGLIGLVALAVVLAVFNSGPYVAITLWLRPVSQEVAWRQRRFISATGNRRSKRLAWTGVVLLVISFLWDFCLTPVVPNTHWGAIAVFVPGVTMAITGIALITYRVRVWQNYFVRDDRMMPSEHDKD